MSLQNHESGCINASKIHELIFALEDKNKVLTGI